MPGKSHGWRSLVGDSPWGRKEAEGTERLCVLSLPLYLCFYVDIFARVYVLVFWPQGLWDLSSPTGIEPAALAVEAWSLTSGPPGTPTT